MALREGGADWLVVLGVWLVNFTVVGLSKSFPVIYVHFLDMFGQPAAVTAWLSGAQNLLRFGCGPLASALTGRFGERPVVIVGGLCIFGSYLLTAFATSIVYVYMTYSVLLGTSMALVYIPSFVVIGYFFEKKKGRAYALAGTGIGAGFFVLPFIVKVLIDTYAYRGTMLLLAAISLHTVISGLLYKPPPQSVQSHVTFTVSDSEKDTDEEVGKKCTGRRTCCPRGLDLTLFQNPKFCLLFMMSVSSTLCFSNIASFPVVLALEGGHDITQGTLLVSILGAADIGANIVWGFAFDTKLARNNRCHFYALLGYCVSMFCALMGIVRHSYPGLVTAVVLYGLVQSPILTLRAPIIKDMFGQESVGSAVGLTAMASGLGHALGPLIGGVLKDYTGSYRWAFMFGGASFFTGTAAFHAGVTLLTRRDRRRTLESLGSR